MTMPSTCASNNDIVSFLKKNRIENYKINTDGTVDVNGIVTIFTKQSKLLIKFWRINGSFDGDSCNLTSLEGSPNYVNGYFSCNYNMLTSLHDIHKIIKEINGAFYCQGNPIKDSVLGLLLINGITAITFSNKEVQCIINKYIGQGRAGVIGAQQELLDAGLDEYARL